MEALRSAAAVIVNASTSVGCSELMVDSEPEELYLMGCDPPVVTIPAARFERAMAAVVSNVTLRPVDYTNLCFDLSCVLQQLHVAAPYVREPKQAKVGTP